MFYIINGDCVVNVTDHKRVTHTAIRFLVEGDHFGEISLLYGCQRSCSVVSRNYSTMARLIYSRFRMLVIEVPTFKKELYKFVYQYNDPRLKFLKELVA
jgi:CRP-like cAMP-binding protein